MALDTESGPAQTRRMGEVHQFPSIGRELFIDEDGTALRASWHLDQGLVNLSVWRGDRCTETFPLAIEDASRLIACPVAGLTAAARSGSEPPADSGPTTSILEELRSTPGA